MMPFRFETVIKSYSLNAQISALLESYSTLLGITFVTGLCIPQFQSLIVHKQVHIMIIYVQKLDWLLHFHTHVFCLFSISHCPIEIIISDCKSMYTKFYHNQIASAAISSELILALAAPVSQWEDSITHNINPIVRLLFPSPSPPLIYTGFPFTFPFLPQGPVFPLSFLRILWTHQKDSPMSRGPEGFIKMLLYILDY